MADDTNTTDNVATLGRDLLFILLWVGAWGSIELIVQYFSSNQKIQLLIYMCLFIAGFVALIFVNDPYQVDDSGHERKRH